MCLLITSKVTSQVEIESTTSRFLSDCSAISAIDPMSLTKYRLVKERLTAQFDLNPMYKCMIINLTFKNIGRY